MEKYRLKNKPGEKVSETEIRVNTNTSLGSYLTYIASLFNKTKEKVEVKGAGYAISKAFSLADLVRKRFLGLHQIIEFGTMEIVDEYEPIEEGLDVVRLNRNLPFVSIVLSKTELDKAHPGYSEPLPEEDVKPFEMRGSVPLRRGMRYRRVARGRRSFWARGGLEGRRTGGRRRRWGTRRRGRARTVVNEVKKE